MRKRELYECPLCHNVAHHPLIYCVKCPGKLVKRTFLDYPDYDTSKPDGNKWHERWKKFQEKHNVKDMGI